MLDRAIYSIAIAQRNHWLLEIALDYLSLGRTHLGLALTAEAAPDFTEAAEHLDRSVEGLRQAGAEHHIPRGLLARASLRRLRATLTGESLAAAEADLREAQDIAERGHMRLHEADIHLEWTRLYLQIGDGEAARGSLGRAPGLVEEAGYGRRRAEVEFLAGRVFRA